MISMVEHIEYLILRNDCVIIPGWGALIAQYAPAYFDMQSGTVISPSRSISFNSSINHNDGLIADSIVRKENISFNEAQAFVNEEVHSFTKQLDLSGEVSIGKLGSFKLKDSVVVFEPRVSENTQQTFFGLSNLKIQTLDKLKENENVVEAEHKSVVRTIFSKEMLKYAASIILLIGMSVVLTTPISMKQDGAEFASFNLVNVKENLKEDINKDNRVLYLAMPVEQDDLESSEREITNEVAESITADTEASYRIQNLSKVDNAKYYLIVASLPTRNLAEKHISQYPGDDMNIIECDGKYRVYIASSNSFKELQSVINNSTISKKYPGTWICKKK